MRARGTAERNERRSLRDYVLDCVGVFKGSILRP